jgi:hypothetical protein
MMMTHFFFFFLFDFIYWENKIQKVPVFFLFFFHEIFIEIFFSSPLSLYTSEKYLDILYILFLVPIKNIQVIKDENVGEGWGREVNVFSSYRRPE